MREILQKVLVTAGSLISIGFGIWHFFVPQLWNWYSYVDATATELILAIRTINTFFSLCLLLFGLMNLLLIYGERGSTYSLVVLGATCVLWLVRVMVQIVSPQGSVKVLLQYGMLTVFVLVLTCYAVSLVLVLSEKPDRQP